MIPTQIMRRGFLVDRFDRFETAASYYAFGLYWGTPQAQNAKGHVICHIKVCFRLTEYEPSTPWVTPQHLLSHLVCIVTGHWD